MGGVGKSGGLDFLGHRRGFGFFGDTGGGVDFLFKSNPDK